MRAPAHSRGFGCPDSLAEGVAQFGTEGFEVPLVHLGEGRRLIRVDIVYRGASDRRAIRDTGPVGEGFSASLNVGVIGTPPLLGSLVSPTLYIAQFGREGLYALKFSFVRSCQR